MAPFAGYDMPLYYGEGALAEHNWTRSHGGFFDVSHMGQVLIEGEGVAEFLEKITPSSFITKPVGRAQYTVLLNEAGGIIDDLIVTRLGPQTFHAVLNAGRKHEDMAWIRKHLPVELTLYALDNRALIAVQGNWAERVMYEIFEYDAHHHTYMTMVETRAPSGEKLYISRTGYTGEDGFEISLPNDIAVESWERLCAHAELKAVGLAARDSLRLEMGYPLYGQDLDESISPVEAGLNWVIRKDRQNFIGAERVLSELTSGPQRVRVGIRLSEPGIARAGSAVLNKQGEKIGALTSGGFSPSLNHAIGLGFVPVPKAQIGSQIFVDVRGKHLAAEIVPLPFLQAKTRSAKK